MRIDSTSASTEPIQTGYHPRNVKKIVTNKEVSVIDTSGFFPFVAITTVIKSPIVNARENIIPASVAVVPRANEMLVSQSDHTTN